MTLQNRCLEFIHLVNRAAEFGQPKPVEDLVAFVTTEIGRASHEGFDDAVPLALYFTTVKEREDFVALILEAKPGMISKRWPA